MRGEAFDRWLGKRSLLFLGDSLQAQTYYSLLWLLGDVVVDHRDLIGRSPEDVKNLGKVLADQQGPEDVVRARCAPASTRTAAHSSVVGR